MKHMATIFGFIWRVLDGLRKALHLIVLLVFFLIVAAVLSPRIPIVPHETALVIAPQGAIVEQLAGDPFERAVAEVSGQGRAETLLRDLTEAIRAAKTDERVRVLVLDLSAMAGGGVAKMEELAAAIRDFRESGKKVIAYGGLRSGAVLRRCARGRHLSRPARARADRGLRLLPHVPEGRDRQARSRRQRFSRRQVQVLHGSVQPLGHVGAGGAGEP
jgi:hypothetical protein